ncbi:MAG TPA: hypothetical protein VFZ18_09610 [Longimicrobiaceae bacterium]
MTRTMRLPLGGILLVLAAGCVGAPAIAPVPEGAPPAEVRAAALQVECRGARVKMDCYSEALLEVLGEEGVTQSMETLEFLSERDPNVKREGHMYAHAIGLAASPSPQQVGETFRDCRPSFQSGCYHGVIQSYFTAVSTHGQQVDGQAVNALCADYRTDGSDRWLLFQCVHGMGHGLTALHEHHLPSALQGCDLLADPWEREGCYGGVFMESIVQATVPHHAVGRPHAEGHAAAAAPSAAGADPHAAHGQPAAAEQAMHDHAAQPGAGAADAHAGHGAHAPAGATPAAAMNHAPFPPLDRSQPLYPCSVLEARYLVACYQMQTSAILFYNGGDVEATAKACDDAPELYRGACYLSLGRDVSALTNQDHQAARTACGTGDPRFQVWCHIGYVKNLVDLTADPEDALAYCRGTAGADLKQACYHAIGEEIWVLTSDRQRGERWCAMAEPGHQDHCRRGAGLASWRDEAAE